MKINQETEYNKNSDTKISITQRKVCLEVQIQHIFQTINY